MSKFRLALVQLAVSADKALNICRACEMVKSAVKNGAQMVVLPECFNSPYGTKYFPEYAEPIPGDTTKALSEVAKECSVYVIGGSMPERDGEKVYNTSTAFNRAGEMVAKYRKMHLFDIDIPGKIRFKESEVLTGGNGLSMFDTEWCKVGLGICYDMRFPELAALYAQNGCRLLCYPGAFNMTTGPAHWELLLRSRALDNQMFAAAISVARDESASYIAWGHTTVVDPWAKVIGKTEEKEDIVYADIDLSLVDSVREQIPIRSQKRKDLYELNSKM